MSKYQHQLLLLLCLFVYTFLGSIPKLCHVNMNYVSWFCVLYFISSYISKYNFFKSISHKKWGYLTLAAIIISVMSVVCLLWLPQLLNRPILYAPYRFVSDSNTVFALLTSVCSFMYFKDLKLKYTPLINTVAASTFGVLLIHAHSDTMRQWLWNDTLRNADFFFSDFLIVHAILSTIGVFLICIFLDYLRIRFFEIRILKFVDKILAKYNLT